MTGQIISKILFILMVSVNFLLPGAQNLEKTTFTLTVALDETCDLAKKRTLLTGIIAEISTDFERDFSIAFAIKKWETWRSGAPVLSIDALVPSLLKQVEKREIDISIALTCRKGLAGKYGLAFYEEEKYWDR